jgi:hypothetical protein
MSNATLIGDVRKAFRDGWIAALADATVLVCLGHPGKQQPDDIVMVGDVTADFSNGPMGPRRNREIEVLLEGVVSVYRKGGRSAEEVASDRAFGLLGTAEEYFRGDGTTVGNARTGLGGLARECFLTRLGPAGGTAVTVNNMATVRLRNINPLGRVDLPLVLPRGRRGGRG